MKRFTEQFNKKSSSVKLRSVERRELKDRLTAYMEYHPLPAELRAAKPATATKKPAGLVSEPFVTYSFAHLRSVIATVAVMIVVSVPFLAEHSLPGDVLYPVKVQFNEEVRSTLSLSPYAKVEWETERLERRIAEARLLSTEGKLTEEVEAEVAKAVKTHTENAQKEIATLRSSDEDEATLAEITFASALAVQSEVLEEHIKSGEGEGSEGSVNAVATAVSEAKTQAEVSQSNGQVSYEKLLARVELETTRAQELFISIERYASDEEERNIERRLSDIDRKVQAAITAKHHTPEDGVITDDVTLETAAVSSVNSEEGSEVATSSLEAEEENTSSSSVSVSLGEATDAAVGITAEDREIEAQALLRAALTDTQKLISFMTDIDVRETVAIDTLVPVTLTEEEQVDDVAVQLATLQTLLGDIEQRVVLDSFVEKYEVGYAFLLEQIAAVERYQARGDYEAASDTLIEALEVAEDVLGMTEPVVVIDVAEENSETGATDSGTSTKAVVEDVPELDVSTSTATTTNATTSAEAV